MPTGYMVIDGGAPTTVSYISNATPIPADKNDIASHVYGHGRRNAGHETHIHGCGQRRQAAYTRIHDRESSASHCNNLLALGNFFSFYDDELTLLNARVPTPMNESTLGRYNFAVTGKSTFGDAGVYIITVTPNSRTLPTFSGTIKILEETFDLLEVDLKPSQSTAITFVKDLRLVEKFERFSDDVWQPTYLVVSGKMQVDIVQGIASLRPDFSITSTVSECHAERADSRLSVCRTTNHHRCPRCRFRTK